MTNAGIINLITRYWSEATLWILFITTLIYNLVWLQANKLPPSWDPSAHLMLSLSYYDVLVHPSLNMVSRLVDISNYYPPFYHFSTAIMYLFFGKTLTTAILTNTVFYGILILSAYGLGKKLFNKETGVFAAVLITLYPSIFSLQRIYMLEIPLAALVALTIYLLVLSDNFKNRKYAVAFGTTFALTILTKWTGLFYIMGPLIVTIYNTYANISLQSRGSGLFKKSETICAQCGKPVEKQRHEYRGKIFCSNHCRSLWKKKGQAKSSRTGHTVNILLAAAVFIFLSSLWYLPHMNDMYYNVIVGQTSAGAMEGDPEIFTLSSILYYLISIVDFQVLAVFFIVFLLGVVYMAREENPNKIFLLSWILVPYIFFTLFRNKDPRTFLPVITLVAVVSAYYIATIKNNKHKTYTIVALIIIGTAQLYTMAAGINSLADATKLNIPLLGNVNVFPNSGTGGPPNRDDWKAEEVIKEILYDYKNNPRTQGRYAIIGVIPDHGLMNGYTLSYFAVRDNLPLNVINTAYLPSTSTFTENFFRFDYIISKDRDYWSSTYKDKVIFMDQFFKAHWSEGYSLIKTYSLPDGSNVSVYRNIK